MRFSKGILARLLATLPLAAQYDIDLDQETLDVSDHSPVLVDFVIQLRGEYGMNSIVKVAYMSRCHHTMDC